MLSHFCFIFFHSFFGLFVVDPQLDMLLLSLLLFVSKEGDFSIEGFFPKGNP